MPRLKRASEEPARVSHFRKSNPTDQIRIAVASVKLYSKLNSLARAECAAPTSCRSWADCPNELRLSVARNRYGAWDCRSKAVASGHEDRRRHGSIVDECLPVNPRARTNGNSDILTRPASQCDAPVAWISRMDAAPSVRSYRSGPFVVRNPFGSGLASPYDPSPDSLPE